MIFDEHFSIMLLTHDFTKNYLPVGKSIANSHQTCEVLNAIQLDTKEAVDQIFDKAIAA
jgi:uncharacterized protein